MSDADRRFHEEWLGMVQPIEGLVFSAPVLEDAQLAVRHPPERQRALLDLCPEAKDGHRRIPDLSLFLEAVLGLREEFFHGPSEFPADLSFWVPEGRQKIVPTLALLRREFGRTPNPDDETIPLESTAASRAGEPYLMLVWHIPEGLAFDRSETVTGEWHYPPAAKFERLLRACRVPMGLLSNGEAIRFIYAPHNGTTGAMTFPIEILTAVGGRPVFDAFCELFSSARIFRTPREQSLLGLLEESRRRQANVTNELAGQVYDALRILLAGLETAAERDRRVLDPKKEDVYGGLLTTLLRLVFMLYAEDHRDGEGRGLLPVEHPLYQKHESLHGLFDQLQEDADRFPDTMERRFGAWPRLLSAFRSIYDGAAHGQLLMPPRRGDLFDPKRFPFLEGWDEGPPVNGVERARTVVPSVDDGTVYRVLKRLLILGEDDRKGRGQRLAYRALDVEQIGSVYEKLMGYQVVRLDSPAVLVKPAEVWITAAELLALTPAQREAHLVDEAEVPKAQAERIRAELKAARSETSILEAIEPLQVRGSEIAGKGRLVLQPGHERRRTSSHYTPPSLTEPVVRKTLEPLFRAMREKNGGKEPTSKQILSLKVCDPAMGSGAFLVAACRYLADQVVAAWTREGQVEKVASTNEEAGVLARRLVAQRCLYGVDRNAFAVSLAKLSLWLATLAKDEPFTFVDHALRHGDSLVGLSFEQIEGFHWQPSGQLDLFLPEVHEALEEARALRQRILDLAGESGPDITWKKETLLRDADDALERAKTLGDLIVGAFFLKEKDADRKKELSRRRGLVEAWLTSGKARSTEVMGLQEEIRSQVPVFHWMLEFPEVFFREREEPLADSKAEEKVWMDAFVGNPPFAGKNRIIEAHERYLEWLKAIHPGSHGNADLSAHFFRRTDELTGSHGTIGLLATNTIGQGDTRTTALRRFLWPREQGYRIYDAVSTAKWPGAANVAFSVVHLAKGALAGTMRSAIWDGQAVAEVNSRLRPKPERMDPVPLEANAGLAYVGSYILGMGFTFDDTCAEATPLEEMHRLIRKNPKNQARIFPYLGGKEVNDSPTQSHHRYVINFGEMSLDEAERWPDLLEIVREKVKPERDALKDNADGRRRKRFWWQFGRWTPALFRALQGKKRCLVTSRVSKHLLFSWQPSDRVLSEQLYVFPIEDHARFVILQSRVHEVWARLLSSSLEDRLRYSASDCFDTFPFPPAENLGPRSELERLGAKLDIARTRIMTTRDHGLTVLYNQLKDPTCEDAEIVALRRLHEDVDRAVLEAYGWSVSEIAIPQFEEPSTSKAFEAFSDEVLDRLFALNAERASAEAVGAAVATASGARRSRAVSAVRNPEGGEGKRSVARSATTSKREGSEKAPPRNQRKAAAAAKTASLRSQRDKTTTRLEIQKKPAAAKTTRAGRVGKTGKTRSRRPRGSKP